MTPEKSRCEKLAAYFAKYLHDEEKDEVDQWRNASEETEQIVEDARKIWQNSGMKLRLDNDNEAEQWNDIKSAIDREKEGKIVSLLSGRSAWLKIAASLVLMMGVAYVFITR